GDSGVVVAEDRRLRCLANQIGALVRRAAVADGVAEAVVDVDVLLAVGLEHRAESFEVRVYVAEDAQPHRRTEPNMSGTTNGANGTNGTDPTPVPVLELAAACIRFV